jgi:hypothetical protein
LLDASLKKKHTPVLNLGILKESLPEVMKLEEAQTKFNEALSKTQELSNSFIKVQSSKSRKGRHRIM